MEKSRSLVEEEEYKKTLELFLELETSSWTDWCWRLWNICFWLHRDEKGRFSYAANHNRHWLRFECRMEWCYSKVIVMACYMELQWCLHANGKPFHTSFEVILRVRFCIVLYWVQLLAVAIMTCQFSSAQCLSMELPSHLMAKGPCYVYQTVLPIIDSDDRTDPWRMENAPTPYWEILEYGDTRILKEFLMRGKSSSLREICQMWM